VAMKMQLTFKESEKHLWDEIQKHHSKSGYIKDALAEYMKKDKPEKRIQAVRF
jgi:hypothetical protein